jgi:hypothetical protein
VCKETIRQVLITYTLSHKRAQSKPTKADEKKQEAFKKMPNLLSTLEASYDTVVYALDETGV